MVNTFLGLTVSDLTFVIKVIRRKSDNMYQVLRANPLKSGDAKPPVYG